ncbi:MAG: TonB-dependent receptor plug domain-containing protein, partial [Parasphingorhabdus sp.]
MDLNNKKRATLATASLLAIMTVSAPALAQQDTSDQAQESTGDVIIVTANRRNQSIQDVPLSITAFDGDELDNRSITSIEQVGAIAPGVQISTYQGDTSIFIRGIGTPSIIAGTDSSTATYIDGVYISRPAAIGPQFFDIDRIEVLRGPQGTLYGRNATGGAVNIVTNRPTDVLEGNLQMTVGNYDRFRFAGALSGPLNGAIRARLAFQWEDRGGYATVTRPDNSTERVEDKEDYSVRLTV